LSQNFGSGFAEISISRGTSSRHGVMALILMVGYLIVVFNNLKGVERVNILWLMIMGISVQFAWDASRPIWGFKNPSR
jgi:hypothetical protein